MPKLNEYVVLRPGLVHILHGPVSMQVLADFHGEPLTDLCIDAYTVIDEALSFVSYDRAFLSSYPGKNSLRHLNTVSKRMCEAVLAIGEPTLTPMAAVAGAISDVVVNFLISKGATLAVANNGGDMAIRLTGDETVRIGIASNLQDKNINYVVDITAGDGIGGIATSGAGGRGFTRGIADGVTAFAGDGCLADALATHLANSTAIESPNVIRQLAGEIDPNSDIADLDVVVAVNPLTSEELREAFSRLKYVATEQMQKRTLLAAYASIQNRSQTYGVMPKGMRTNYTEMDGC